MAALIAVLALSVLLVTESPWGQKWLARVATTQLTELFGTHVEVGKVHIALNGRLVLDDVELYDQTDSLMLSATRMSAKMALQPLTEGRVRINNIQLFGYHAVLRKPSDTAPYNFQFIIDRFKKDDEPSSPLDLSINTIVVRRGTLEHHIGPDTTMLSERKPQMDLRHLVLDNLAASVSTFNLTNDSINVEINSLSFKERRSGFDLDDFHLQVAATPAEALLADLKVVLPHSQMEAAEVTLTLPENRQPKDAAVVIPALSMTLTPTDLQPLIPPSLLPDEATPLLNHTYQIEATGAYRQQQLVLSRMDLGMDNGEVSINSRLWAHTSKANTIRVELEHLTLREELWNEAKPLLQRYKLDKLAQLGKVQLNGWADLTPELSQAKFNVQSALGQAQGEGSMTGRDLFELNLKAQQLQLAPLTGMDVRLAATDVSAKGSLARKQIQAKTKTDNLRWGEQQLELASLNADFAYDGHWLTGVADIADIGFKDTRLGDIHLESRHAGDNIEYRLQSGFMEAQAEGNVEPQQVLAVCSSMLHNTMPSLFPTPQNAATANVARHGDESLRFDIRLTDIQPIATLTGADMGISQPVQLSGVMDQGTGVVAVEMEAPSLTYGSEELKDISLSLHQQADSIQLWMDGCRQMDFGQLLFEINANASSDSIQMKLDWDSQLETHTRGHLVTSTRFSRDDNDKLSTAIHVKPSQLTVNDTLWNIHPSQFELHSGKIMVQDFSVSKEDRHLRANGTVSRDDGDTLQVDLRGISLEYVFNIVDFHAVDFGGQATGTVFAHGLMSQPVVDADLNIDRFTLNEGLLGKLHVIGGWGRRGAKTIDIEGHIVEPTHAEESIVDGTITLGHDEGSGLELDINARRINAYFINRFTSHIFQDLEGTASGHVRLFGPFKQLDLDGGLVVDTAALRLGIIGTRYHLAADSLLFRPGRIIIPKAYVLDPFTVNVPSAMRTPSAQTVTSPADVPLPHCGILSGEVRHNNFSIRSYRFDVYARELLGYDFRDFGDQVFYGTVYANGHVGLEGRPGILNVTLEGTPTIGTSFTYNASNPDITTENAFINFVQSPTQTQPEELSPTTDDGNLSTATSLQETASITTAESQPSQQDEDEESDMHINFDLDITPDATMRILMDARSGDYITLAGNGHIRATYFNKGAFQMYGTYHIDHGTYKLSLQDIIRKDFQIQQGSTITFGGAPLKGDLNLRAIYTVPSVSLNDLASGANFSNSSVRVNCIMNIGGRAEQPQVAFDFDIPNVNEDEKQMVRSLIATEEERNLQVMYLLGIGRFYTYNENEGQNQANTAMQSLLSSTLSGQLNEYLGRALGNTHNWNFGTNLSTGNMGWNDMDVEGMLSGRLLNNRLLINGTFGYRDTPVANTNFIGDFDVQYLLTPSGNISLKAYSETNDRYFTKTALTTQGIGIVLKKDFNTFSDLFRRRRSSP